MASRTSAAQTRRHLFCAVCTSPNVMTTAIPGVHSVRQSEPSSVSSSLDSDQAVAEYLTAILEENNASLLADVLGDVARARGMTEIARASGMAREAL